MNYLLEMYQNSVPLVLDFETTSRHKGKYFGATPYDATNFIVLGGVLDPLTGEETLFGAGTIAATMHKIVDSVPADKNIMLIGCNIGFDLSYIMHRYPMLWKKIKSRALVWDISVAHYLMCGQSVKYPSMDDIAKHYGLPLKPDTLKSYLENDIDVDDIPKDELENYLRHDLTTTEKIASLQIERILEEESPAFQTLCFVRMEDILMTTTMEVNGMYFNRSISNKLAEESLPVLTALEDILTEYVHFRVGEDVQFNPGSGQQIAAFLYGGEFKWEVTVRKLDADGKPMVYKSGMRKGLPVFCKEKRTRSFVGILPEILVSSLEGRGTDEERLLIIKGTMETIEAATPHLPIIGMQASKWVGELLRARGLRKDISTYYEGYQAYAELDGRIHTNINQTGTVTGRLSSSSPNLQNAAHSTED